MIESLVVTLPPVLFLALLYGSEAVLRLRGVYASGDLPIGKTLFACCKFAIMIPWGVMILRGWGVTLLAPERPEILKWPALGLWILGFALLISGRLGLGRAFRIGLAKEKTSLKENGAFRFSRNPMYVGIDATLAAAALYTVDPIVFAVGVFIAAVHHKIVLAEEARLRNVFGEAFVQYCRRVKRYI